MSLIYRLSNLIEQAAQQELAEEDLMAVIPTIQN